MVSENVESVALNGEEEACNLLDKEKEPEMIKETFDEQTNTTVQDYKETVNSSDSSGNLKEVKSYASMVNICPLHVCVCVCTSIYIISIYFFVIPCCTFFYSHVIYMFHFQYR